MIWCHNCQKQASISAYAHVCVKCGSGALERFNNQDNFPVGFRPYIIGSEQSQRNEQNNNANQEQTQEIEIPIVFNIRTIVFESLDNPGQFRIVRIITRGLPVFPELKTPVSAQILEKLQRVSNIKECTVCQEEGGNGIKLNCSHCFHENCVKPWFEQTNTCPTCRRQVQ